MKAKLVKEDVNDIFKPKSEKEIEQIKQQEKEEYEKNLESNPYYQIGSLKQELKYQREQVASLYEYIDKIKPSIHTFKSELEYIKMRFNRIMDHWSEEIKLPPVK